MLRIKIILTALVLGALLFASAYGLQPVGASITFEADQPQVPEEMYILKVVSKEVTEERTLEIAFIFGVNGEVETVKDAMWVKENSREVRVYEYGRFRYSDYYEMNQRMVPPEDFLSDERCIEIADRFLENLRNQGLVSESLEFSFVDVVADLMKVYSVEDNTETTYWTNKHVNYVLLYEYDNIPLSGGMAKVRVYLNELGEIVGFFGDFWEVEPYKRARILSPEDAISRWLGPDVSRATVKGIRLVYDVSSLDVIYIKPSYDLLMELEMDDGEVVSFLRTIPAVKE